MVRESRTVVFHGAGRRESNGKAADWKGPEARPPLFPWRGADYTAYWRAWRGIRGWARRRAEGEGAERDAAS